MNDIFGIQGALKELGLKEINNGSSTGSDCFSSGELLESYSPVDGCLLYTSPSPRDKRQSRMPSSA